MPIKWQFQLCTGDLMSSKRKTPSYDICLWLVLVVFCMQFVVSFCLKEYWHQWFGSKPDSYTYILMTQLFSIVIPCLAVGMFSGQSFKRTFNLRKIKFTEAVKCILLGICLQPVAIFANIPLQSLGLSEGSIVSPPENIVQILIMVAFVCIVPALCEEFFMRGMVMATVKRKGFAFSVLVTTVMFVILHADVSSAVGYAVLGFAAAFAVLNTNSVFAGFFVHFAFNACGVMLDYFLNICYIPNSFVGSFDFFMATGIVGLIFSVAFLYMLNNKKIKKYKSEDFLYNVWDAFINIPFAAIITMYILFAVM